MLISLAYRAAIFRRFAAKTTEKIKEERNKSARYLRVTLDIFIKVKMNGYEFTPLPLKFVRWDENGARAISPNDYYCVLYYNIAALESEEEST